MVKIDLKDFIDRIDKETFITIYNDYSREIKTFIIFIGFLILDKFLNISLKRIFDSKLINIAEEKAGRFKTLFNVLLGIKSVILWIIAFLLILSLYQIKLTTILTGFGIIGIIIGLASQAIIADFFAGIALLLDRFFYIGDRIKVGEIEGEVIDITLRRTYIKDDNGYIHSISNSQLKTISKKN
jgi:small-conductance mechanosensitive channel